MRLSIPRNGWPWIRRDRRLAAAAVLLALMILGWAASALWRASDAVDLAEDETRRAGTFPFDTRPLPAAATGVEYLNSPVSWRDGVVFQDRVYLCGATGLTAYSLEGALLERFRSGERLPAAPLVAMTVGLTSAGLELWIASSGEGLIAYNGREFRHLRPREAAHRKLTALVALPSGRLLLGTERAGVLVYDGKRLGPFHPKLNGFNVTALAGDESGVWAGTVDRGLLHWHSGQVDEYGEVQGLPDPRVLSIALHQGGAYVGTAVGVSRIHNGRVERVISDTLFARAIQVSREKLWVGTHEEGVYEFPLAGARRRPSPASNVRASVERLLDLRGSTYALLRDGLHEVRSWKRVIAPEESLLTDGNIAALHEDSTGQVWVGYFDRGLDVLSPGRDRVKHLEDEHLFCVNRIVQAPDHGGFAVATANGLVLLDANAVKRNVLGRSQGLIANHVTDVALMGDRMVVATPAGLTFLGKDGARSLYAFHGLVNNHVYALASSGSTLLAGTLGGLSVLDGDFVRASYNTANSPLRHNWITALIAAGREWYAGTYGSGVYRLEADFAWHAFADMPAGVEVNPNAMASSGSRVYAGTLGRGLLIYEIGQGRWSRFDRGLPSLNVTAVAAHSGHIYIGTDNGLVRIAEGSI